jgi:penicillin-binding protein 1A
MGFFMSRVWMFLLILLAVAGGYVYWATRDLPSVEKVLQEGVQPSRWTQVLAKDGSVILSYGKFRHQQVKLKDVSPHFTDALLATEDRRFYSHMGVDPLSLGRAIFRDIRAGKLLEGGSTLTQQLARNVFLSNERSLKRKVREAVLALNIEQQLSKDQILEMYVNNTYFGEGAYGIQAASEIYFNKKPSELSIDEAALLAGMPQAPSQYSPFVNPDLAKKRRNEVLANLVETGQLEEGKLESLQQKPFNLNPLGQEMASGDKAPFFNRFVMTQIQKQFDLDEQTFWQSGLKIYTTLDSNAQTLATRAVRAESQVYGRTRKNQQAALFSLDPKTGAILAYVGGKNYAQSQFDRVSQAMRSPGSLFKVFTYTTAIEKGLEPNRVYLDEPISFGEWSPKNYDGKHKGLMTLAQAFASSNNIVAVKLMNELGPASVIDVAQRMGLHSEMENSASLTLGSASVNLLDITAAYAVIANGGVRAEPYAIEKIVDADGNKLYEHQVMKTDVLSSVTTDTMISLMMGVVHYGTGTAADIGRPMAGKTGTSDDNRDAWFIGFTPDIVTGVWVGNDDNSPMPGMSGGGLPAVIWRAAMRPYLAQKLPTSFDLKYSRPVVAADFSTYDVANIADTENPDAVAQAQQSSEQAVDQATSAANPEQPQLEPDPAVPVGDSNSHAPLPPSPPLPQAPPIPPSPIHPHNSQEKVKDPSEFNPMSPVRR